MDPTCDQSTRPSSVCRPTHLPPDHIRAPLIPASASTEARVARRGASVRHLRRSALPPPITFLHRPPPAQPSITTTPNHPRDPDQAGDERERPRVMVRSSRNGGMQRAGASACRTASTGSARPGSRGLARMCRKPWRSTRIRRHCGISARPHAQKIDFNRATSHLGENPLNFLFMIPLGDSLASSSVRISNFYSLRKC
jgi:hypothetical protein